MELVKGYIKTGFLEMDDITERDADRIADRYLAGHSLTTIAKQEASRIRKERHVWMAQETHLNESEDSQEQIDKAAYNSLRYDISLKQSDIELVREEITRLQKGLQKIYTAMLLSITFGSLLIFGGGAFLGIHPIIKVIAYLLMLGPQIYLSMHSQKEKNAFLQRESELQRELVKLTQVRDREGRPVAGRATTTVRR